MHGATAGTLPGQEPLDGIRVHRGQVCVGVRARVARVRDARSAFARELRRKADAAYRARRAIPGVCQTAPGRAPYFYEEDNWADDMELAAAELYALTRDERYRRDALDYAAKEPVTPWMGADTARHYQWYPWHNAGHYALWRNGCAQDRATMAAYYRRGLEAVVGRATNGFRVGIPFIWCSNDLMVSFATQALLYRRMTGDARFREYEQAAIDWLFGTNPWGVSMVVGYPRGGRWPRDPHSVVVDAVWPGGADGRARRRSGVPVDLHEPARHRPATRRRLRRVQHGASSSITTTWATTRRTSRSWTARRASSTCCPRSPRRSTCSDSLPCLCALNREPS